MRGPLVLGLDPRINPRIFLDLVDGMTVSSTAMTD
jgi:hypothetical protein